MIGPFFSNCYHNFSSRVNKIFRWKKRALYERIIKVFDSKRWNRKYLLTVTEEVFESPFEKKPTEVLPMFVVLSPVNWQWVYRIEIDRYIFVKKCLSSKKMAKASCTDFTLNRLTDGTKVLLGPTFFVILYFSSIFWNGLEIW